jgi:hypothetical protein
MLAVKAIAKIGIQMAMSGLFNNIGGPNLIGGLFSGLTAHAAGGDYSGNSPILVGEKGPEILVPRTARSVIPNSQITFANAMPAGGASSHSVTYAL